MGADRSQARCVAAVVLAFAVVAHAATSSAAEPAAAASGPAASEPDISASDLEQASPGQHCVGQPSARWFSEQILTLQAAPSGGELEAKLGACWPLIRGEGELFDYTRAVLGLDVQATAGYVQLGPYLELMPVSVLGLRAELHWVDYFPAGFAGAGYFPRPSYDAGFRYSDLPADDAAGASGYNAVLVAWLQLELEVAASLSVFAWNEAALEHWSLGDGPYYYNARWDSILAADDELVRNDAYVGASLALTPDLSLGFGPMSSLRHVPRAGYTAHQLGAAFNGSWQTSAGSLRSLDAFVAAGGFVAHSFRRGPFLIVSLIAGWDLGAL
jgi:hypothetical protein